MTLEIITEGNMTSNFFGEMEYATGWKTKRKIELFAARYDIVVKIQAYEPEDAISEVQERSCQEYIENEKEYLECIEKMMLEYSSDAVTRFSPRRLLFDTDGGCALLCDDALDMDEGIAVCIIPEKCIMDQSDYL